MSNGNEQVNGSAVGVTEKLPYCAATTRKGQPCRNRILPGQAFCRVHTQLSENGAAQPDTSPPPAVTPSQPMSWDVPITTASPADQHAEDKTLPPSAAAQEASTGVVATTDKTAPSSVSTWPAPGGSPADAAYELEVEIRNHIRSNGEAQAAVTSDLVAGIFRLIAENLERMAPPQVRTALEMLQGINVKDYLDPDFWKGIWMVVSYQINEQIAFIQRRLRGEYEVDPYGMDRELIEVAHPFLTFMYRTWWRVNTEGLDYIPDSSRALLVANHSGVLPWDSVMITTAVLEEHSSERLVRNLFQSWMSALPVTSSILTTIGQAPGLPENAVRLLEKDELVCVFPEGEKGTGKLYKDRYRLARFGRGGYVQAALQTGAPLIPVAVVGAEEIYPMIANAEPFAKLLGVPYFPITPLFPWLGVLGAIPLPTRWSITICPPISTAEFGPDAADDPLIVFMLSEQVRCVIQETIDEKLKTRTSLF
ncbi:MAG: 1-acyl-sn-glycerol-3-phosphate acyltransferase [Chloroflexales bacterium]|nr:1-acyl-sn-glycerol-3-phosphate acyltransferase [Chloroflexales bacterium]